MTNITRIDIRKINDNGRYIDLSTSTIIDLTDEQILTLRQYYNDESIARNRQIRKYSEPRRTSSYPNERREYQRTSSKQNYKITRDQKYNNGRHRTKRTPHVNIGKLFVIGSIVVCVAIGGKLLKLGESNALSSEITNNIPSYSSSTFITENERYLQDGIELPSSDVTYEEQIQQTDYLQNNETNSLPEYSSREIMIKNICDIYQVDYNTIYNKLITVTDNFSSADYLNGTISGVTCKGVQVHASSEEELLVYAIRCMKQLPETMGLREDSIHINNGYTSDTNYLNQINRVADLLGIDRCLMYAIVQSECGFNSDLFNNKNNPAGIKGTDGKWWVFDTKEEGFFELGMEILKYYRKIGVTPDNIDYETLSQIRDIHAPLSDNNDTWLPNVTSNLEYAKLHEAELFGSLEQNNGLYR